MLPHIMWMVRAGRGGNRVDDFIQQGVAGFLEDRLPDIGNAKGKDELLVLYAEHYPKEKEGSRAAWANQIFRLLKEMKVGDRVVVGGPERRRYVIGTVNSDYVLVDLDGSRLHARRVQWTQEVSRDALSTETKNSLGAVQTIFKIRAELAKDLGSSGAATRSASPGRDAPTQKETEHDQEELSEISADTFQRAKRVHRRPDRSAQPDADAGTRRRPAACDGLPHQRGRSRS